MRYLFCSLLFVYSFQTYAQIILEKGEAALPNDVWEINQYKRVKDLSDRRDAGGEPNMDWAKWKEWERLKKDDYSRSTELGEWQNFGPDTASGRIISIAFHPTDSNTFYVGSASGGLWRTTDYGNSWNVLTDGYPAMAIGAIAINPLNPSNLIIATGEGFFYSSEITYGVGILISNDAGETWETTNITADLGQAFAGIDIYWSKADTNNVCVATSFGVFYSNDGGNNYILSLGELASRMVSDPQNPDTLYLTARYYNASLLGGFYRSYDGGQTWEELLGTGLPTPLEMGYASIAIHKTFSNIIFVNVSTSSLDGIGPSVGLYRSNDYGNTFTLIPTSHDVLCYSTIDYSYCLGWYSNTLLISDADTNTLYAGGVRLWKSTDGGSNWYQIDTLADGSSSVHSDHHQTIYHPLTNDIIVCHDGGVSFSSDEGLNWNSMSDGLITFQYYTIAVSELAPNTVIGGTQDMGIMYSTDAHNSGTWDYRIYGDVFGTVIDHNNPAIWYATVFPLGGRIKSFDAGDIWYVINGGITEASQWRIPLVMDPSSSSNLLTASDSLIYKTTDGTTWNAKAPYGYSSKMTFDKINPSIVYANSQILDELYISIDGGENWETLPSTPGYPVTDLEVDPTVSGILYATIGSFADFNQVFVSDDFGVSWTNISNDIPSVAANSMVVDPFYPQHLYVGTDLGVWFSANSGISWEEFNHGLAYVQVEDMHFLKADTTLRIGTYGRGYWKSKAELTNGIANVKNSPTTNNKVTIYPNPTNGIVYFGGVSDQDYLKLEIYDLLGGKLKDLALGNNLIDLSDLPNGVYVLRINNKGIISTEKIIKQ